MSIRKGLIYGISSGEMQVEKSIAGKRQLLKKRIFFALKGIGLAVLLFAALFPIYRLVLMAIRPTAETSMGAGLIPQELTMEHFTELFTQKGFGTALKNSLVNSVSALVMSLILGLTTAYIIARKRFRFKMKKPLTYWVLLVRVLPPVAFVIPLYTLFTKWNLMGTRLPIILSCMLVNIPLVIWFMVSFFEELPEKVEESGNLQAFLYVCMEVDFAVQQFIRGHLEELDPVDGTTNLIHDYRANVISLALMQKGSMVLGMIYNPYADGSMPILNGI